MQPDLFQTTAPKTPRKKAPHRMTIGEFMYEQGYRGEYIPTMGEAFRGMCSRYRGKWTHKKTRLTWAWHLNIIRLAIKEGKRVPRKVLKDYPELEDL